jgi:hypothetical protein
MRRALTNVALAVGLFWLAHGQFRHATGVVQLCDSGYSLAVSERLLTAGSADLAPAVPADPKASPWYSPDTNLPYQLVRIGDSVYYGYPLGSSVLSVPFVRTYVRRGLSVFRPDGALDPGAEGAAQQKIAAKVAAATVVLFFAAARFYCPPVWAALVAAGVGFGSPVYSTLSRALWSHTWQVFLLAAAVVVLVAARRVKDRSSWIIDLPSGMLLGTMLSGAVAVRPHAAISAVAVGVYLLGWHRRLIPGTLLAGVVMAAGYMSLSYHAFGTPTPPSVYAAGAIDGRDVLNRFAWLMASPSRGLLVYCPYLVAVGYLLVGYRRQLADRSLLVPAGLAVAGYVAVFSAYDGWHAGSSYGPRYFSDVIPWFALASAMAVGAAYRSAVPQWRKAAEGVVLATAVGWAVFVHHRGANAVAAWEWNYLAARVGQDGAAKDWAHPQFLAGLTYRVLPDGSVTSAVSP